MTDEAIAAEENHSLKPGFMRRIITISAVFIVVLELLDVTIVNVALPDIQGSLGAKVSTIAWVITAYVIASALITPLTGFISKMMGRRLLLLIDIPLFIVFSCLCGLSTHIGELIFFRACQGLAAGTMVPCAEAVLIDIYPKKDYSKAMSFFGVGVMLGPVLGPVIGGIVDQKLDWHWVFFVNLPLGLIAMLFVLSFVRETKRERMPADFLGLILMAVAIISVELLVSQGNSYSWFQSDYIVLLTAVSVIFGLAFLWRGCLAKNPIVNLKLFLNPNFSSSAIFIFVYGTPLLGSMVMIPLLLGSLGSLTTYPPMTIGLLLLLRGFLSLCTVPLTMPLIKLLKVDTRVFLVFGALFACLGNWWLSDLPMHYSMANLIWPIIFQGIGTGLIMPNLFNLAFATLPSSENDEAAGVYNFCRSLGFSIGVTVSAAIFDYARQVTWQNIGQHISVYNPYVKPWLKLQGLNLHSPTAYKILGNFLAAHSQFVAYTDTFRAIAFVCVGLMLLSLFFSPRVSHLCETQAAPDGDF